MTKKRKPDNPDKKPDIIIHFGDERCELTLPPGMDANKIAAEIDAILHPQKPKD